MDTNPWQGSHAFLPEVLVGIETDLIDLKALGVIFVIEVAQMHDALGAALGGEHVEVEHHHLTFELSESADIALAVRQSNLQHARGLYFAGVDLSLSLLGLYDTHILHALQGDVVEVGSTLRLRIVGIPACCHGSEDLHVFLLATWIEDKHCLITDVDCLEECEISVGFHRRGEDILALHLIFIAGQGLLNGSVDLVVRQVGVLLDGVDRSLQSQLHLRQFLHLRAVIGTFHLVLRGHRRVRSFHRDILCGVDSNIDDLPRDTQPIVLWGVRCLAVKGERAVLVEFHRVYSHRSIEAHILEIEQRVFSVCDDTRDVEFLSSARGECQSGKNDQHRREYLVCFHHIMR